MRSGRAWPGAVRWARSGRWSYGPGRAGRQPGGVPPAHRGADGRPAARGSARRPLAEPFKPALGRIETSSPGGVERYMEELFTMLGAGPPDPERPQRLAAEYGITPLPSLGQR